MDAKNSELPQQCAKLMQRLYVFVDTKDIRLNMRLNLVVNPEVIKILFKQVENQSSSVKLLLYKSISNIYSLNKFNSLILAKRDQEIMEFNHSILQSIIQFIFTIKIEPDQVQEIANYLVPFIHSCPINGKIIKSILSVLIKDFYNQKINHSILKCSIFLLQVLLKHQKTREEEPYNYFITCGEEGGLKLINRNLKWPFEKGFHLYLTFYIQNFMREEMNIFTLSIQGDDFIIIITSQGELKFKIFSSSQLLTICQLHKESWITFSLSYTLKNKLLKNVYELICIVNGEIYQRRDLPVPEISMNNEIVQMSLARTFYGRIHLFALTQPQILQESKLIMNTWNEIQSFLERNKKNLGDIFALYSPILRTWFNNKQIIYDISSQNHAQMLQNTGIHYDPFGEVDINYYGGLYTYLPLIHLLKFYDYEKYPDALTDIFELYFIFFDNKFINVQNLALHCQFLSIVSQHINQINPKFLKIETVKVIKKLNLSLSNILLRKQMLVEFLFKINIRKIDEMEVVNGLLEIIEWYFIQHFEWSYGLITIDGIFHYIIDNFEEEKGQFCCFYHYSHRDKQRDEIEAEMKSFKNPYILKATIMSNILKIVFSNLPNCTSAKHIHTKIMQILFSKYSSCLKLLLLQSLNEGVKTNSKFYMKAFNLVQYIYLYLEQAQLPQELACLFEILMHCQLSNETNTVLQQNNIHKIANNLDKIYCKKCEQVRFRGKTSLIKFNGKFIMRKHSSAQKFDQSSESLKSKVKTSPLKQKYLPIETNKNLYQAIINLCFEYNTQEKGWLLKHDDYCFILQPYFCICCEQYRIYIVNMIRNTIFVALNGKKFGKNSNQFNKLYKLLLTQFVFKELQSNDPQQPQGDQTIDIISNVYFIVDYIVINMKEDFFHLYVYLLRLFGVMQQAKKEICQKTHISMQHINTAIKLSNRKFVIRVVKLSQKTLFNFSNIVFLIYLIVFGNHNQNNQGTIFRYFKSIQKYLFIGNNKFLNVKNNSNANSLTLLDSKLILQTVNNFNIFKFDLFNSQINQVAKMINAFLDLQYTNQQNELYINRFMYLIKAQFKELKSSDNPIKQLIMREENKRKQLSTGQIISIISCICIECGLNSQNNDLFQESLNSLMSFFLWFLLLSSRDGLKQQYHHERNKELPKTIGDNVLHFLYTMFHSSYPQKYIFAIEGALYRIFVFLGLIIKSLCQKLGNPQNFEKAIQKALVLKNVEQYNFFTFDLLKEVLALKDLKHIPDISRQKVVKLIIRHPKVSGYFKNKLSFSIELKIDESINNHMKNVIDIRKEVEEYFQKARKFEAESIKQYSILNYNDFQKEFISDHLKQRNLDYRNTQRVWMKIWKRLRQYHYFWSVSMNQRQCKDLQFKKNACLAYRHKFSKFVDTNGVRSVLEVEHVEPWHVKKVLMEKEYEYRNSNYLYHLHQSAQHKKKQKSLIQKLIKSQTIQTVFYVDWIKHNSKRKGYLSIDSQSLKFKYLSTYQKDSHLQFTSFILAQYKPVQKYWPLVEITNIIVRRYLTMRQCLLIQFQDGTSLILNFINEDKDEFIRLLEGRQGKTDKMSLMKLNKIRFFTKKFTLNSRDQLEQITNLWRNHKISNFKYLMLVNKYAGRSYLDPANYPVFPWIIANYDSQPTIHRDLTKTVGALGNEQRTAFFRSKIQAHDPFEPVPPYQFGTHYSSPGVVFSFMVRLQPYTQASRTLQGGKFDLPDRLFSSLKVCWKSVTSEVSDVRELIPQFFYLPEFLLNIDQLDFGITQHKERIHNIQLPNWACSAYEFITRNRKEIQSDYVSQNIGNWIDLIFGYKQKGGIAEENLNLFFYLTYQDAIQLKDITDQQTRISREAQIMHFGQTPSQLWTKPHGGRPKAKKTAFNFKKINLMFSLQSAGPMSIIGLKDNTLILFHNYKVLICHQNNTSHIQKEVIITRNNSKQNTYFLEEIEFKDRVQLFCNQKFIAVASYINGDLLVFSLPDGKKVQEKKGTPKLCILVNQKEDLLLVGSRNGLLQVYQIVYGQKDTLSLIKIAFEYYMTPINSISQGGNFFSVISGSLVTIIRASRSLSWVHDKVKMRGVKMIRALQLPKKIEACLISTDPLFCFVIYTSLQLYCYSANGQLLVSKQVEMNFPPIKFTFNFIDYIAYVENNRLKILSLPFLMEILEVQLPNKIFNEMKFYQNKFFLVTNFGQIITLSQQLQEQK